MALTPPADTDIATMQALERVEERLGARIERVEERLGARIDKATLRLRVLTLVTIIAVQGASTGFLSITLR
jgi:hypothetical protein